MDKRIQKWIDAYSPHSKHQSLPVDRFVEYFAAVNGVGITPSDGNSRFPYTIEHREAMNFVKDWMKELGMGIHEDEVGNVFGKIKGIYSEKSLMIGSHIDTVPEGGMFDGVLGVLSALCAVDVFIKQNGKPKCSIEVAVFVDEEGSRFNHGLFGSRTIIGDIDPEVVHTYKDEQETTMAEAMRRDGLNPARITEAKRDLSQLIGYLELHIEQGALLEGKQKTIGVVEGIAGPARQSFTFRGSTDHAGNTPMNMRKDALVAASELIVEVEKLPPQFSDTAVATIGKILNSPNGTNVIAGKTEVTVDIRDVHEDTRNRLIEEIIEVAQLIANKRGLQLDVNKGIRVKPVHMNAATTERIEEAARELKIPAYRMMSGAGHDAMILGREVPTGMIFVPSQAGKSHSPEEWTTLSDCLDGILVLERTIGKVLSAYDKEGS